MKEFKLIQDRNSSNGLYWELVCDDNGTVIMGIKSVQSYSNYMIVHL